MKISCSALRPKNGERGFVRSQMCIRILLRLPLNFIFDPYDHINECLCQLGRLSTLVMRPVRVPKHVRFRDILNSDVYLRFLVFGNPNSLLVVRNQSPCNLEELENEVERQKELW